LEWKEIDVSDVQWSLLWLILLSMFTIAMSISVCVVIHHFNQRLVKLESRDNNQDLRLVWDKIGSMCADNTGRDYRITKLESEEYFGDIEDEDDDDSDDFYDKKVNGVYYFAENAVKDGCFVHLGKAYRVSIDKNEG
jgi:hypothetical protein